MKPFSVRQAAESDADDLVPLFEVLGVTASREEVRNRFQRRTENDFAWVARMNEAVVGILTGHSYNVLHRTQPVGRITLLAVAPDFQGRGIGRRLVSEFEDHMQGMGCGLVEVISNLRYRDAYGFYQHLGYAQSSTKFKKVLGHE